MPELQWRYGYLAVWVVMGIVVAGLILFFKKKKWI
jgi:magnesium transporter